ncbi:helix-turn-helix domain-containing protein [Streptomyces sp. NPDC049881]|uniref:helix-turn-helix transcriptional regulator n=1 Tax=Streptomyces sp. NPDC049881 TaxID=3155778 RepID=UPI003421EDBA
MRQTDMLKLPEVLQTVRISRAAFYRLRSRGQAPKLHKLPNGHIRVRRADLDAWLERLAENSA